MTDEAEQANADLAWWRSVLGPLGYTITGWTWRVRASGFHADGTWHEFSGHVAAQIAATYQEAK